MEFTSKDIALAVAVTVSIFCLIAMIVQYIQNVDYKQRVNDAFSNVRQRISTTESSITSNAGSIVALQTEFTQFKHDMTTAVGPDNEVIDWDKLTADLKKDHSQAATYVANMPNPQLLSKEEQEAAVQMQYQQMKSSADHLIDHRQMKAKDETNRLAAKYPHYYVNVEGLNVIDFYRIAQLYGITDPCIQHVVKKLLATGNRGHKKFRHDIEDSIDTLKARLRMLDEDGVE